MEHIHLALLSPKTSLIWIYRNKPRKEKERGDKRREVISINWWGMESRWSRDTDLAEQRNRKPKYLQKVTQMWSELIPAVDCRLPKCSEIIDITYMPVNSWVNDVSANWCTTWKNVAKATDQSFILYRN